MWAAGKAAPGLGPWTNLFRRMLPLLCVNGENGGAVCCAWEVYVNLRFITGWTQSHAGTGEEESTALQAAAQSAQRDIARLRRRSPAFSPFVCPLVTSGSRAWPTLEIGGSWHPCIIRHQLRATIKLPSRLAFPLWSHTPACRSVCPSIRLPAPSVGLFPHLSPSFAGRAICNDLCACLEPRPVPHGQIFQAGEGLRLYCRACVTNATLRQCWWTEARQLLLLLSAA